MLHILFFYNTPYDYGLDHETRSVNIFINDYERAERVSFFFAFSFKNIKFLSIVCW